MARRRGGQPRRDDGDARHLDRQFRAPHHSGRDRRDGHGRHLGRDGLSRRRDRHHPDGGMVRAAARPAHLPADRGGAVHRFLGHVRPRRQSHHDDHRPRGPGLYRRGDDPDGADHHRDAPAPLAAADRHRPVRRHSDHGPGDRPAARWLAYREYQLALRLLHQPAHLRAAGCPAAHRPAARAEPSRPAARGGLVRRGGPRARPRRIDRPPRRGSARAMVRIRADLVDGGHLGHRIRLPHHRPAHR